MNMRVLSTQGDSGRVQKLPEYFCRQYSVLRLGQRETDGKKASGGICRASNFKKKKAEPFGAKTLVLCPRLLPGPIMRCFLVIMATPTLDPKTSDTVQALVQLLRSRSSEEIRQRMYDNPPGSPWWAACKTELDLRNSERAATALVDTSRVLDKLRSATDHLDELTGKLVQATTDMAEIVKSVRESGRRMEIATYVIVGLTIVQLFYIAFQFSAKH